MKVLTRYLLRAHIGPFVFAFVTLTGVILINTLARELANLAGKGLPLGVVFEFFVLSLPANIALTLPMAVLVSVLYTFSTLAAENEITALKASGIDLRRATLPVLIAAAAIAAGMVWFNDQVLPAANYRWRVLMTDVAQTRPLLALNEDAINPIRTSDGRTPYYLQAQQINAQTGRMQEISIFDVSEEQVSRTIVADSGKMAFNSSYTDLLITLFDGNMREVDFSDPAAFQLVDFDEQVMRMKGVSDRLQRTGESAYRTDRDMTVGMMEARIDTLRAELAAVTDSIGDSAQAAAATSEPLNDGEAAALAALREAQDSALGVDEGSPPVPAPSSRSLAFQGQTLSVPGSDGPAVAPPVDVDLQREAARYASARADNIRLQIREYQVEIQKKYSIAAATLVFVLIGIPVALRFPAGGIGMVVVVSLAVFGIYYVGLIGGETLADKGYLSPQVSMWLTNLIFAPIGLFAYLKLGRERGTSRGGTWGELPAVLTRWAGRSGGKTG